MITTILFLLLEAAISYRTPLSKLASKRGTEKFSSLKSIGFRESPQTLVGYRIKYLREYQNTNHASIENSCLSNWNFDLHEIVDR